MVDLEFQDIFILKELRVAIREELGEKLMLSDPDLYKNLERLWHKSGNPITKSKIRRFLNEKQVPWSDPLK